MTLLDKFMKDLMHGGLARDTQIIGDDARMPTHRLRKRMIQSGDTPETRYNLDRALASRRICRYNSEPIRILESTKPPKNLDSFEPHPKSCRWMSQPSKENTDELMVIPQRRRDRWSVSRNSSDSALLSIFPKRSTHSTKKGSTEESAATLFPPKRHHFPTVAAKGITAFGLEDRRRSYGRQI